MKVILTSDLMHEITSPSKPERVRPLLLCYEPVQNIFGPQMRGTASECRWRGMPRENNTPANVAIWARIGCDVTTAAQDLLEWLSHQKQNIAKGAGTHNLKCRNSEEQKSPGPFSCVVFANQLFMKAPQFWIFVWQHHLFSTAYSYNTFFSHIEFGCSRKLAVNHGCGNLFWQVAQIPLLKTRTRMLVVPLLKQVHPQNLSAKLCVSANLTLSVQHMNLISRRMNVGFMKQSQKA